MRKGFTLVELSIVLVIIGLSIGGILVGQSMMSTARLQSAARQLQEYDIAVTNFQTRYNQLPGDDRLFGTPLGNNDGLINRMVDGFIHWSAGSEKGMWKHLYDAGYEQRYSGFNLTATTSFDITSTTPNAPKFKLGKDSAIIPGVWLCPGPNCYIIANLVYAGPGLFIPGESVTTIEAAALDAKIDDGIPESGNVISSPSLLPNCLSGSQYDLSNSGNVCAVYVKMQMQSAN